MSRFHPFHFWSQKVLPLVYDDSLSYYEVLCKVVSYINGILADLKEFHNTYLVGKYVAKYVEDDEAIEFIKEE